MREAPTPMALEPPDRAATEAVDAMFSQLLGLLDRARDVAVDRAAIDAYLSCPDVRDPQMQAARSNRDRYRSVTADVLLTATELSDSPAQSAQELLVDWVVLAPRLILLRLCG